MKKKLLTAVVGAALVAGMGVAHADAKIDGYLNMSLDYIKGKNGLTPAGNSNNWDVSSNASNFVFSGSEDLGGGLKGVFNWQEFVRFDNNNGNLNAGGSNLSGGNSWLGLSGDTWGTVLLGNNDSGAKINGRTFDLFGNQIGDSRDADVNNNRVGNLIAYLSPNWAGFSFLAAYSTNTAASLPNGLFSPATFNGPSTISAGTDQGATSDLSAKAQSLMLNYTNGPLVVGVGYDKVSLGNGSSALACQTIGSTIPGVVGCSNLGNLVSPKWLNVGAKYSFPTGTDAVVFYQKHDAYDAISTGDNIKTMGVGVAQHFGNNTVKAQYYQVKISNDTSAPALDGLKPKLFALGFDHSFSKTFTGYVAYAEVKNDGGSTNATGTAFTMAGGGHGDNPGVIAGDKSSGFSVGAIMKF